MVLGRIIELVDLKSHMQELQLYLSSFSDYAPDPYFYFVFFLFMEGNSATFQNILILLGSIIE